MMLGKKKQQTILNAVSDERTPSNGFCLRTSSGYGNESYRPADYRDYYKLNEDVMIPLLDEHINKMLAGDVDDANGDMLNNLIFSVAFEAFADLDYQKSNHNDTIRRLVVNRTANKEDLIRIKKERERECDMLQSDYDKLNNMLSACGEV